MGESGKHTIREVYSQVLFELAEEGKKVDQVVNELTGIRKAMHSNPEFAALVTAAGIDGNEKAEIMRRIFKDRVSDLTLDFVCVLARHNRLGSLGEITGKYEKLVDAYRGRHLVEVTLASEPDQQQKASLEKDLEKVMQTQVKMQVKVDPKIIGGIIINRNGKVIDNSLRTVLKRAVDAIFEKSSQTA